MLITTPVVDAVATDPVTRSYHYSSTCRCDRGRAVGGSGPVALAVVVTWAAGWLSHSPTA